jgi:hypothetical protein
MPFLDGGHPLLFAAGAATLLVGAWIFWAVLKRFGRRLARRPQKPWGTTRYLVTVALGALFAGVGLTGVGVWLALKGLGEVGKKTHVAEVQAIELGPQKLRVYYVAIERDGRRGATETYDVDGDQWTVGGDVLRFRPLFNTLGIDTVYQVTRVEGRWLDATAANAHKATAHDRGKTGAGWLQLYRNGSRGPLGWVIAGTHGQAVSQLPDRRAVYDLYVTPNGFIVDKKTF